ncbi:hypothetical protein CLOP_g18088 [Closterium sp. NIES-67]|nr:hypothetical protein CLOP_g18088 [Closterium sp. NIES-67]
MLLRAIPPISPTAPGTRAACAHGDDGACRSTHALPHLPAPRKAGSFAHPQNFTLARSVRSVKQPREQFPRVAATRAADVDATPSDDGSNNSSSRREGYEEEEQGVQGGAVRTTGELYAAEYDTVLAQLDSLPPSEATRFNRVLHILSVKYPRRHVSMGSIASQNLLFLVHLSGGALSDKQLLTIFFRNPSLFQTDFYSLTSQKTALFNEYGISSLSLLRAATRACVFSVSEETLAAALHFLRHDLGVKRIDKVVQSFPFVLNLTVPTLKEKVRQLELAGLAPVADIIETSPFVLGGRASEIQRKVLLIQSILGDYNGDKLYYLRRYPQLLLVKHETTEATYKGMVEYFGEEQARRFLLRQPLLLGQNWDSMVVTLTNLIKSFGREDAVRMMNQMPLIIAFAWETLESKIRFVVEDMGRGLADVAMWPALLTRSVDKRLRPRYKLLLEAGKAHKYGLGYMFGCKDVDFERRFGLKLAQNRGEEEEEGRKEGGVEGEDEEVEGGGQEEGKGALETAGSRSATMKQTPGGEGER